MKRFYTSATVEAAGDGFEIRLDGRGVKTPARNALALPSARLAEAVAAEWASQGEKIHPRSMPFTGLANAAIDRVAPDRHAFAESLARYGESDLLCYRAEGPAALVARQSESWDPILAWARRRFDVDFQLVQGIMHSPQPEMTVRQLGQAVASLGPFQLAGLSPLVTIGGSVVVALALAEGAIGVEEAWAAASLDEAWQMEQWGEDAEAAAVLEARRRDFLAGYEFLSLL